MKFQKYGIRIDDENQSAFLTIVRQHSGCLFLIGMRIHKYRASTHPEKLKVGKKENSPLLISHFIQIIWGQCGDTNKQTVPNHLLLNPIYYKIKPIISTFSGSICYNLKACLSLAA